MASNVRDVSEGRFARALASVFSQLEDMGLCAPRRRDDYLRKRPHSIGKVTGLTAEERLRRQLKASLELCSKQATKSSTEQ